MYYNASLKLFFMVIITSKSYQKSTSLPEKIKIAKILLFLNFNKLLPAKSKL